jgi:glycosyltransferase involved in cell wall biosynthesis
MPKVLRIINRFNLGGPTFNAAYLSKYMAPEFETLLVGGEIDETEERSLHIVDQLGLEPIIISEMKRPIRLGNDYKAYKKIKDLIAEFKPDIVHTHASKAGALGRMAAHNMKVPVIIHTFHGHVFDAYFNRATASFYKILERRFANISTAIIAICEQQKYELTQVHKICSSDKVSIIPLGFDLMRFQENMDQKRVAFRSEYLLEPDEIAIGIIGRVVPIKNHNMFLEAIDFLNHNTSKKVRAFIIGDGEEKENIMNRASEMGLDVSDALKEKRRSLITFTSWLKDVDCVDAGLDIIALTSLNEGTPVSLIEAQAANKPIVSTKAGGIENVVIPDITALLSEVNDQKGFSENLLKLVENDRQRLDLSLKGWDFVKNKFHYTRLVNDMSNLYNDLLQKKGK